MQYGTDPIGVVPGVYHFRNVTVPRGSTGIAVLHDARGGGDRAHGPASTDIVSRANLDVSYGLCRRRIAWRVASGSRPLLAPPPTTAASTAW